MKKRAEIFLNHQTYPLYVGGSEKNGFRDWEEKGASFFLEPFVQSDMYGAKDLIWNIEDPSVVCFSQTQAENPDNGKRIQALRTGITKVAVSLPDGTKSVCTVTVIDNYTRMTVSEIVLNTDRLRMAIGSRAKLLAFVYPRDYSCSGRMNTKIRWESSDVNIAYVERGEVIAAGLGETTLFAVSEDVGRKAHCHVTILPQMNVEGYGKEKEETRQVLQVGKHLRLNVSEEVVWRTENREILDVDENGNVSALSSTAGKTDTVNSRGKGLTENTWVYATFVNGGAILRYPFTVIPAPLPIHTLFLSPTELSLPKGTSRMVSVCSDISIPLGSSVCWESSAEEIVTVHPAADTAYGSAQAEVRGRKEGTAILTAWFNGKTAECSVTVTAETVKVQKIILQKAAQIDVDQVLRLQAVLTENATNQKIHWIMPFSETATLDREGCVQGYRPGNVTIWAIADDSLSGEEAEQLWKLKERGISNETDIQIFLKGKIYAACTVTVRDPCPALRNLHVVQESVSDHSVLLLWNRASLLDTGDFDHYQVFCNGKWAAWTKKLGWRADQLRAETLYEFRVEAVNDKGQKIAASSVKVITGKHRDEISVLDFGAAGDGKRMDTLAIQRAIDAVPEGGTVVLPKGYCFLSGALFLKSHMTFCVDGVLMGSANPKDYPGIITRWEGWRKLEQKEDTWENATEEAPRNHFAHASLINAGCYMEGAAGQEGPYGIEDIVICGRGQINANGFMLACHEGPNRNTDRIVKTGYPAKDATLRGSAIRIHNGRYIYCKDIQVAYAPAWTVHAIYCKDLTFDGMEVISQGNGDLGMGSDIFHCGHIFNGDGIDPDSCRHVNIFDVRFTTGDDAVAIKSGRGREGNELDKPNAYIRVTDCSSVWSLGGFGTGSETAAGSHDLLFQNLFVKEIFISAIWLKTNQARGGMTENIQVRDIFACKCNSPIWIFHEYSMDKPQINPAKNPPIVRRLVFENIQGDSSNELGIRIEGTTECPVHDVQIRGAVCGGRENRFFFCDHIILE